MNLYKCTFIYILKSVSINQWALTKNMKCFKSIVYSYFILAIALANANRLNIIVNIRVLDVQLR